MTRHITYAEALREAQDFCLGAYPETYLMGLGVPDPKGVFGSTLGLQDKYGPNRVFDVPLSENAMTGVALGSAISGMRPILTHQRVDFALSSIEQLVNQAAKWHYMFGGQMSAPMVVRMVIGRGWGQGPQHSQSLHSWFAHIPGLKVILPTSPHDAKGMLISAIEDDNPVICLEHRWLYGLTDSVPEESYRVPIGEGRVVRPGTDITLVGVSYMTLECLRAAGSLAQHGVSAEVIDLRSARPLPTELILSSIGKTGLVLSVDHAHTVCGVAGEISAMATEHLFDQLQGPPQRLGLPDHPVPTSPAQSKNYYPLHQEIVLTCMRMMSLPEPPMPPELQEEPLDQPDISFVGPF
jgi:pyruvate dehydrogenase E1 component beta subunit|tara:strand:- start:12105 stop:13160 length:1056 start_codon:yes stop_codon:yes gene_type:complete